MIIERKQYGAVSVLLVQIGLALYVIVVFLAQGANGTVSPKVLKVQKVAEAKQAKHLSLASSAQGQTQVQGTHNLSTGEAVEQQILALISAPAKTTEYKNDDPSTGWQTAAISDEAETPFSNTDVHILGSKPRAPTFA